ncbi:MAG: hypothetical protein ACI9JM_000082 [Halioglobus sp.]|jgi:hypothetical protein
MNVKYAYAVAIARRPSWISVLAVAILPLLFACSDSSDSLYSQAEAVEEPFTELFEQGIVRYLGLYSPMLSETDGDVVNHFFGTGDGPLCGAGGGYSMATRDQGSDELVIFIEGGGACWSDFCFYVDETTTGIPSEGILDPQRENNPVRSWNQVYLPYCDGSLSAGDMDVDTDGDGVTDRFHRGLHNLSASLDVAAATFPAPTRILLTGQSGGALSTIFALPLVRYVYPDAQIDIVNDSGVGVARPDQPEFLQQLMDEWNMNAFIPASCDNCLAEDGHFTDYLIWQMDQDISLRRALMSYTQDTVLADTFLQIGGPAFEQALREELKQQEEAHPGRSYSWLPVGNGHTFLTGDPDKTAGSVPLMDWISAMLSGSEEWVSVAD